MGESEATVDAPITYNPMEESEATGATRLEVSVSFGRFENDLLAWEKWSTFPTNKYLEEVEKCSTPGSVAQKKAYFEAHYKKIAARKAEQEDQDKKVGDRARDSVDSEVQAQRDLVAKFCEVEQALDMENLNNHNVVTGTESGNQVADLASEMSINQVDEPTDSLEMGNECKDLILLVDEEQLNQQKYASGIELENEVTSLASGMRSDQVDESKNTLSMANENKDLMPPIAEVKDKPCCTLVSPELHGSGEPPLVKDEAPSLGSERVEELPQHIDTARDIVSADKEGKDKFEKNFKSTKATKIKKATNTPVVKKKPDAVTPRSSILSTPKLSRPALSKSIMSDSRGPSKKEYGTSPVIKRKPSRAESRRAAPTSLHMSLTLGPDCPANSEPAPSTTMRKSLIMEKMGDKDIVKRAFKAFRNDFNQVPSSSPGKPTLASKIPEKETGIKASIVRTPQKTIGRVNDVVKKNPQSSQPGLRKTSDSTRLPQTAVGGNQRNLKSVSPNYGLRSHNKPDKIKELSKNLEDEANGEAAQRTQLQSEVKKETQIKRLLHNHYTKAKPIVGTAKPKGSLDKKNAK